MKQKHLYKTLLQLLSLGLPMVLAYVNRLEMKEAVNEAIASIKAEES